MLSARVCVCTEGCWEIKETLKKSETRGGYAAGALPVLSQDGGMFPPFAL